MIYKRFRCGDSVFIVVEWIRHTPHVKVYHSDIVALGSKPGLDSIIFTQHFTFQFHESVKMKKKVPNFMKVDLLVALENDNRHIDKQTRSMFYK